MRSHAMSPFSNEKSIILLDKIFFDGCMRVEIVLFEFCASNTIPQLTRNKICQMLFSLNGLKFKKPFLMLEILFLDTKR